MSERVERFEIDGRPSVILRIPAGEVRLLPSSDGAVVIRLRGSERALERFQIERSGRQVSVEAIREFGIRFRSPAVDAEVEVPEDADVEVRVALGEVRSEPPLRTLSVDSASGDIVIEGPVGRDLSVKSASGEVRATAVGKHADVSMASGDVRIGSIDGDCRIVSASGDVRLGTVSGSATLKSASGDIVVERFEGDHLNAKTMSGDVSVGVPPGRRFEVSFKALSGDVRTDFPVSSGDATASARLAITSLSGDITVHGVD